MLLENETEMKNRRLRSESLEKLTETNTDGTLRTGVMCVIRRDETVINEANVTPSCEL